MGPTGTSERERERERETETDRVDRGCRGSGNSRREPVGVVLRRLRLNARYCGFGAQRQRDKRIPTVSATLAIVLGLTLTSLGGLVVMPGALAAGGGQVYVPPYSSQQMIDSSYLVYGGPLNPTCPGGVSSYNCGAEAQPDYQNVSRVSLEPISAFTGIAENTQSAAVGEVVRVQNGIGPYYATVGVRGYFTISQGPTYLPAGNNTILEGWVLHGEARLQISSHSAAGGNLVASYAMQFGVELTSVANGLTYTYTTSYSAAQLQCAAPCNQASTYSLNGTASPLFSVSVPPGSYLLGAFAAWNTTARETGTGDAGVISCLVMGIGPWCSQWYSLPSGQAQLQSVTVV